MALFILDLVEGLFLHITEKFTSGVIQCYQGQNLPENCVPLLQQQDPLEDFKKFDQQDTIFQEYDPPVGDDSRMGWKKSRPTKWWISLWKAMKYVFCIQILGGLAVGFLAVVIVVLEFNSADLCYGMQYVPKKIKNIILTGDVVWSYLVELWSFLLILTMFGWQFVKRLNLLSLNLIAAFLGTIYRLYIHLYKHAWMSFPLNILFLIVVLMNSILVAREIANNSEIDRIGKLRKTTKFTAILSAQFAFGALMSYILIYAINPLYGRQDDNNRALIAGTLPLLVVIPKAILRLTAQRIDFLHPGSSYILMSTVYSATRIVFRIMQAELSSRKLFVLMSFWHGSVDLIERLTILLRDYMWFFVYKKLKRNSNAEAVFSADKFRTPRSMRLVADMSIQMILGESTALITAMGFIQMYSFMYNNNSPSFTDMHLIEEFCIRVAIGLSIDLFFNSFSFWLQMSYYNVAVVQVWKKKWKKHMTVCVIVTALTMCYCARHLFPLVKAKHSIEKTKRHFNCTGPFSRF